MDRAYLNIDILHLVMAELRYNKGAISNIAKTCRELNVESSRYLLQDGALLCSDEDIISFVNFLEARRNVALFELRVRSLRDLRIEMGDPPISRSSALSWLLFRALPRAPNLVSLTLYYAEDFLAIHPAIPISITELPALREISVGVAGATTLDMIRRISGLTQVEIGIDWVVSDMPSQLYRMAFLQSSASTLREIHLKQAEHLGPFIGGCLPLVQKLTLTEVTWENLATFCTSFPSLNELEVDDPLIVDIGSVIPPEYSMARLHNQWLAATHGWWRSLKVYKGSLTTFYTLGIPSHVPFLHVDDRDTGPEYRHLAAAVNDVQPLFLAYGAIPIEVCLDGRLALCCQKPGWQKIKYLELFFYVEDFYDEEVMQLMDAAGECLKSLRLVDFSFDVSWSECDSQSRPDVRVDPRWDPFVVVDGERKYLTPQGIEAHADYLMATVDKLKSVELRVRLPRRGIPFDPYPPTGDIEVTRGPCELIGRSLKVMCSGWQEGDEGKMTEEG